MVPVFRLSNWVIYYKLMELMHAGALGERFTLVYGG